MEARARPIDPAEEMLRQAGHAMLLIVPQAVFDLLAMQARAEGRAPGDVLDAAVRAYLRAHGGEDVREYLRLLGDKG